MMEPDANLKAGLTRERCARLIDGPVVIKDVDELQAVPFPRLEIVRIVCRRDLCMQQGSS